MLACAIVLSFTAHIFAVFPFDLKISHELQEEKNPVFAFVMKEISVIGNTWIGIVMIGAVSVFYFARRQVPEGCFYPCHVEYFRSHCISQGVGCPPASSVFFPGSG